jgi:hypothetical protein
MHVTAETACVRLLKNKTVTPQAIAHLLNERIQLVCSVILDGRHTKSL